MFRSRLIPGRHLDKQAGRCHTDLPHPSHWEIYLDSMSNTAVNSQQRHIWHRQANRVFSCSRVLSGVLVVVLMGVAFVARQQVYVTPPSPNDKYQHMAVPNPVLYWHQIIIIINYFLKKNTSVTRKPHYIPHGRCVLGATGTVGSCNATTLHPEPFLGFPIATFRSSFLYPIFPHGKC